MTSIEHDTWTTERTYPTSRAKVFAAWSDPAIKRLWFVGPDGEPNHELALDFQVGGIEQTHGTTPDGDRDAYDAHYHDIITDERIIYTYAMAINDERISVSVASVELHDDGDHTRLVYTEPGAYLDGLDNPASRRGGVGTHLDNLGTVLIDGELL